MRNFPIDDPAAALEIGDGDDGCLLAPLSLSLSQIDSNKRTALESSTVEGEK
jgi:hypothetical protein